MEVHIWSQQLCPGAPGAPGLLRAGSASLHHRGPTSRSPVAMGTQGKDRASIQSPALMVTGGARITGCRVRQEPLCEADSSVPRKCRQLAPIPRCLSPTSHCGTQPCPPCLAFGSAQLLSCAHRPLVTISVNLAFPAAAVVSRLGASCLPF